MVTKVSIKCTRPSCGNDVVVSDPLSEEATALNKWAILGVRMTGGGRATLANLCACMDLLPVSERNWVKYNKEFGAVCTEVASASCLGASKRLHELKGVSPDEIIECRVSVHGTWSKRRFTAMYGVVVVISWESEQVLDYEVLSKHCMACSRWEGKDKESQEYLDWWEGRNDSCNTNYSGSSPAMEVEGVKRIWLRSVEKLKLMYTSFISDGDSKSFFMLENLKPYSGKTIVKHECVGHVAKRVGTRFRKLVQSKMKYPDGQPARFGRRFTGKTMDALGVYYGGAIRDNIGDVDAMEKAIWAVFHHCFNG